MIMALKRKINFNIDKLRLCYKQPDGLFEAMVKYDKDEYIDYGDFKLKIIDNGKGLKYNEKPSIKVIIQVIVPDGNKYVSLGQLTLHNSAKYEGYCFFSYENKELYNCLNIGYHGDKHNSICYMSYIANVLHLSLNNITEIEIAADCNVCPISQIRKKIRNYEKYDMIMNGKRITDERRKIYGYAEMYGRSRYQIDRIPTLYFSQQDLQMRVYDKSKEIAEVSDKKYISQWNDYGKHGIYRVEIALRNEDYRQWLAHIGKRMPEWGNMEASVELLDLEAYRSNLWHYCAHRMLYFKPKGQRNLTIDLIDIISGAA